MRAYRLDGSDVVAAVLGEWDSFARLNAGAGALGDRVVGRLLWDMMQGDATTAFLERQFYDCRRTQTAAGLLYRCDSPEDERLFRMRVEPAEHAGLLVSHTLIRIRPQKPTPLREVGHAHYRKCSQCLSCNFGGPWLEAARLRLPADAVAVDAVCPACQAAASIAQTPDHSASPAQCG